MTVRGLALLLIATASLPGCGGDISSNERAAANALSQLVAAERDLLVRGRPCWTGDIAGLHRLGVLSRELAEADAAPVAPLVTPRKPYHGYLFVAMEWDDTAEPPEPLKQDSGGTGKLHHPSKAAWCAYPSAPGSTGRRTYFTCVGMRDSNRLFGVYNDGRPVLRWPNDGGNAAGWAVID